MAKPFLLIMILLMGFSFAKGQNQKPWKLFDLDRLSQENANTDGAYFGFLNEPTLDMGLFELKAGAEDHQQPHPRDEVYYITKGVATLQIGDDSISVEPGSIVYVKTEVPHRFVNIKKNLQVLVVFSNSEPSAEDPDWKAFHLEKLMQARKPDKKIRKQFLDVATMCFGLQMLPNTVENDRTSVYESDEINIVTHGSGTIVVGKDKFEVKPGSIFFVENSAGHSFKNIRGEMLEILILHHK